MGGTGRKEDEVREYKWLSSGCSEEVARRTLYDPKFIDGNRTWIRATCRHYRGRTMAKRREAPAGKGGGLSGSFIEEGTTE